MSANTVVVSINGTATEVRIRRLSDGGLLLVLGSRSHTAYAKDVSAGLRMVIDGKTCLFPKEYDPSHLRAEMAGKLTRFLAEDGATLKAGDPCVTCSQSVCSSCACAAGETDSRAAGVLFVWLVR